MIGQTIDGRYQIEARVGQGGMGIVYKATDLVESQPRAIKALSVTMSTDVAATRLHREFRVLTRLDHPRIVRAYNYGFYNNNPYLVMEFLNGHTLADELAGSALHRTRLLHIARQLTDALMHLHAQSIIHRDLKPGNIMLLPPGDSPQVKLMDFGLVRITQQQSIQLTQEGSTLGTVAYMAPEQAQGFKVDFRADLYALGIIMYEMATGRPPFVHENPATVLLQQITTPPLSPRHFNPAIDEALADFILELLAKDPNQRPESTALVATRIKQLINEESSPVLQSPIKPTTIVGQVPLIGREEAFRKIVSHWDAVQQGNGQLILLEGVAGAGKGRFLTEARNQAKIGSRCYFQGRSREQASIPYQPIVDVLTELVRRCAPQTEIPTALRPLLPDIYSGPQLGSDPNEARLRLFTAFLELLQQTMPKDGLLITLEEMQWADPDTLDIVGFLANRIQRLPIMLVLAYRPEEVERGSNFDKLKRDLQHNQQAHTITLDLLTRPQVGHYLRIALGWEKVPDWLIDTFYQATSGNPLFIQETLKVLSAEGQVAQWRTLTTSRITIMGQTNFILQLPQSVLDLAQRRLQSLSSDERSILTTAAVLGPEFAFELLKVVSRREEEPLIDIVDQLLATNLIEELPMQDGEDRYTFAQEALRQALLNNISRRRRRLLHKRSGEAIAHLYDTSQPRYWPALAYHFAEAGQKEQAIKYFILAGDDASEVYAYREATAHYTAALTIATEIDANDIQLHYLLSQRGRCLEMSRLYTEALNNYQTLANYGAKRNNPTLTLTALIAQAAIHALPTQLDDANKAQTLAQKALELARQLGDAEGEAKALTILLNIYTATGDFERAIEHGEAALTISRQRNLSEQLATTLSNIQSVYLATGQPARTQATIEEATRLYRQSNDLRRLGEHLGFSAYYYYLCGAYETALTMSVEAAHLSQAVNNNWGQGFSQWAKAYVYLEQGRIQDALSMMEKTLALELEQSFLPTQIILRSNLAWAYGTINAVAHAVELAEEAERLASDTQISLRPNVLVILAQMHIKQGQLTTAVSHLKEARSAFNQKPNHTWIDSFYIHIVETELAIAQKKYGTAVDRIDQFIGPLRQSGVNTYLAEALFFKGKALIGHGNIDEAALILNEANDITTTIQSRRMRWLILLCLSHIANLRGETAVAQSYQQQAQTVINIIANHIQADHLRQHFLNHPAMQYLVTTPQAH